MVAEPQAVSRLQAVLMLIGQQKERWALPADARVVISYEAGQDAFWIFRTLQACGIECHERRQGATGLRVTALVVGSHPGRPNSCLSPQG